MYQSESLREISKKQLFSNTQKKYPKMHTSKYSLVYGSEKSDKLYTNKTFNILSYSPTSIDKRT